MFLYSFEEEKEMKARMAVIRFDNKDVIATSSFTPGGPDIPIVIPDGVCAEIGVLHFFTTGRGTYNAASNMTTAPGVSYIYNAPGSMTVADGTSMSIAGNVSIPKGKFFYFNGQTYTMCDPQAHAR